MASCKKLQEEHMSTPNIVKVGNSAHAGKCIKARYKNINMETVDANSPKTISIMSNGVIDVSSIWDVLENCNTKIILIITANCLVSLQSIFSHNLFKPTMDTLIDYTNPLLDSYRSSTHDAILVYGFIPDRASSGVIKTTFMLEDGLRYAIDS